MSVVGYAVEDGGAVVSGGGVSAAADGALQNSQAASLNGFPRFEHRGHILA